MTGGAKVMCAIPNTSVVLQGLGVGTRDRFMAVFRVFHQVMEKSWKIKGKSGKVIDFSLTYFLTSKVMFKSRKLTMEVQVEVSWKSGNSQKAVVTEVAVRFGSGRNRVGDDMVVVAIWGGDGSWGGGEVAAVAGTSCGNVGVGWGGGNGGWGGDWGGGEVVAVATTRVAMTWQSQHCGHGISWGGGSNWGGGVAVAGTGVMWQ
ncbi:hypothetical protein EDB89DRAFT_1915509 [Lactarius sanguifluus]|nr:hypothetical protein EDB89DRAFT_1915509 [Lactarius sanguifluus]